MSVRTTARSSQRSLRFFKAVSMAIHSAVVDDHIVAGKIPTQPSPGNILGGVHKGLCGSLQSSTDRAVRRYVNMVTMSKFSSLYTSDLSLGCWTLRANAEQELAQHKPSKNQAWCAGRRFFCHCG